MSSVEAPTLLTLLVQPSRLADLFVSMASTVLVQGYTVNTSFALSYDNLLAFVFRDFTGV